jgi:hypothetical protein
VAGVFFPFQVLPSSFDAEKIVPFPFENTVEAQIFVGLNFCSLDTQEAFVGIKFRWF